MDIYKFMVTRDAKGYKRGMNMEIWTYESQLSDLASNIWAVNGILSIVKHNGSTLPSWGVPLQVSYGDFTQPGFTTWDPTLF